MNLTRKHKENIRQRDRIWFTKHLTLKMMYGNQIHHTWGKGDYCYLVSPEQHRKLDME